MQNKRQEEINVNEEINFLKQVSPTAWQHINFLGRYEFEKMDNLINIDEIVDKISQKQIRFSKMK